MQNTKTNIVLIGFAGCGKSCIGQSLSYLMQCQFMDTDEEIEATYGNKISDIFANLGEVEFRKLETEAIKKIASYSNAIIATGGGCIKNSENMNILRRNGITVYLQSSPQKIYDNIKHDTTRPLLQTENKLQAITNLLNERTPLYEKYSDITVDITELTIKQAAELILKNFKQLSEAYNDVR